MWHDTYTTGSNVIDTTFPGPDADVRENRRAHDAVCEVPHRFDRDDRIVLAACFAACVAVIGLALWGHL